jgi:hypothetical protein
MKTNVAGWEKDARGMLINTNEQEYLAYKSALKRKNELADMNERLLKVEEKLELILEQLK